jgi:hypothetical protein
VNKRSAGKHSGVLFNFQQRTFTPLQCICSGAADVRKSAVLNAATLRTLTSNSEFHWKHAVSVHQKNRTVETMQYLTCNAFSDEQKNCIGGSVQMHDASAARFMSAQKS